jgi:hypothetical protein
MTDLGGYEGFGIGQPGIGGLTSGISGSSLDLNINPGLDLDINSGLDLNLDHSEGMASFRHGTNRRELEEQIADAMMIPILHYEVPYDGEPLLLELPNGGEVIYRRPLHQEIAGIERFKNAALAAPDRRYYGVHIVGHDADPIDMLHSIAKLNGCQRVDQIVPGLMHSPQNHTEIIDWKKAPRSGNTKFVPTGWYPWATGLTDSVIECWQALPKKSFWQELTNSGTLSRYDWNSFTVMEVRITTWSWIEAEDRETRLEIVLKEIPTLNPKTMAQHQKLASKIINDFADVLRTSRYACSGNNRSEVNREMLEMFAY